MIMLQRTRAEQGSTFVEYTLVISVLVVLLFAGAAWGADGLNPFFDTVDAIIGG